MLNESDGLYHARLTRRQVLVGGAVLGGAALGITAMLEACATTSSVTTLKQAATITIEFGVDIATLDPVMTATVGTDLSVISQIYSSLLLRGPDLKLHPSLADTWTQVSPTLLRFKLRPGIRFPNGEALDAAAVKWNIDRALDPQTKARVAPWFASVQQVNAIDPATVDIVLKHPDNSVVPSLASLFLLAPKWTAQNNPAASSMGSGPYVLKEWLKNDHITLEARGDYWGPKPSFQTVVYRIRPEASSRVAGLLAGELDVITAVDPADFGRIRAAGANAGSTASSRVAIVKLNTLLKPMDNLQVRQALNYATDKESIVKFIFQNLTVVSPGELLTPIYFGYNPDLKPYPYDPEKAKSLLASAGYGGGIQIEFDYPTGTYLLGDQITQAIIEQWAKVGVKASLNQMPLSVYIDKYLNKRQLSAASYISFAWPTLDADGQLTLFESGNAYAYWDDATFSSLIEKARALTDPGQRLQLYKQATQRMYDQVPVVFLFPQPSTYAVRATVDWKARSDDWARPTDMTPK